jgi:hypothetical protein
MIIRILPFGESLRFMRKRIMRIGLLTFAALLAVFVIASWIGIDRGEPKITGSLSKEDLASVRRAVRNTAAELPFHWLSNGDVSASWFYLKQLYTYRILSIRVIDTNSVHIFTTNTYYRDGTRRPDFVAGRIDGQWEAAPIGPGI